MTAEALIHEMPKGLVKWYDFQKSGRALYISAGTSLDISLAEAFAECGLDVVCMSAEAFMQDMEGAYRYIGLAVALERAEDAVRLLEKAYASLEEDGTLLLAADNRMAVRYFCGDRDPYTGRNFDGIENYQRTGKTEDDLRKGRLYAKAELVRLLESARFFRHKFYSVFPEIACPQVLLADGYTPNEELNIRIFPQYHHPDTVFLEEENLYESLVDNGMLHAMANGFLIECTRKGVLSSEDQITLSMERGREHALCTMLWKGERVMKKPLYAEGIKKLEQLERNRADLLCRGISMVDAKVCDGTCVMPFVCGTSLVTHFRTLLAENPNEFLRQFDELWQMILRSSEHTPYEAVDWENFDPRWGKSQKKRDLNRWRDMAFGSREDRENLGVILKRGYIDLVLLNGIFADGKCVFFDQELYIKNLPAKAILLRNIDLLYSANRGLDSICPREMLFERYGLTECKDIFYAYIRHFLTELRNDDVLSAYHEARRRNTQAVHSNRQRMNYSTEEYLKLFVELFQNIGNRTLYLFGSGNFARKFLALYKEEYEIAGILDNNQEKWGQTLEGVEILSPDVLEELDPSTYKVIICIKNYVGVLRQVRELGSTNIGIYDTNREYAREKQSVICVQKEDCGKKKKYHIGYVAGVFDLFHVGHLNLLRRASELCDHLIVGVVTDEGVRKNKNTACFIPFEERLAVVQACRYVDEAVGIPLEFGDTRDAYLKFKFDVQFSGSDYVDDPAWLKKRDFLRKHGAELVFFPYTDSTSSTKIKAAIDQMLK